LKANDFFKDKVMIVTGATSGIGRELALLFARFQARVVLAARRSEKLAELEKQIRSSGGRAISIKTDMSDSTDVRRLVKATLAEWNRIDIFISNAGQYIQSPIDTSEQIDFKRSFDINFYGSYYAVKEALPHMIAQNSGHFVFINSLDAKKGIVGDAPYVTAKFALDGFADVLRQEVKSSGIRVTTVYPGRVDTPMIQDLKVPWVSAKISAAEVAKAVSHGIMKRKPIIIVPRLFFPLGALNSTSPRLLDWFYSKFQLEGKKIL
jgi:NADP-dependent 3-hydroxy acid dehydrogenase YdfG